MAGVRTTPPVILLPPSEGKAPGGSGSPWAPERGSFAELDERRVAAIAALVRAMRANAASRGRLLGVKGDALAAATAANRAVRTAPTMAAIDRYTGVLYDALDAGTLSTRDRRRLDAQVVVLSALWGLVRPTDPIPDYKLKMGATLSGLGKLSTWWRPAITDALAPLVEGRVVWDLLPNEHAAAWDPPTPSTGGSGAPTARLSVRFLDETAPVGGERRFTVVNHWNKLLKGAVVHHVLAHQLTDPAGLAAFTHPQGYVFDPTLTVESDDRTTLAMVRPAPATR